jgi:uncharacterized protein
MPRKKSSLLIFIAAIGVIAVVCAALLVFAPVRAKLREVIPGHWITHLNGYRFGYTAEYGIRIAARDGVKLAATLYLPRHLPRKMDAKLPAIYVRHTYDRLRYGEGLYVAEYFAGKGYAVIVQDARGKFASEGKFMPYEHGTEDGAATLDWIAQQSWSNGRVGTIGCSALGELQYVLARANHPAHRAMIPMGAGGAVGSAMNRYSYFGVFEGGIFQLASGFGWMQEHGTFDPRGAPPAKIDIAEAIRTLPVTDMLPPAQRDANGFTHFVNTPLDSPAWHKLDYLDAKDLPAVPALVINTWGDQTVGDTLALAEHVRMQAPAERAKNQHVIIAPGNHCNHEETGKGRKFGDFEMANAEQPYFEVYLKWFDFWLRDQGNGLNDFPAYRYYVIGEQRWRDASTWPPAESQAMMWHLQSGGNANSKRGDGVLSLQSSTSSAPFDEFRYDPQAPVPSVGGPVCCTGNPADRPGLVDQSRVEERDDVLIYTSEPLKENLIIAGPLKAKLTISSTATDTDFIARLAHVRPDGLSTNIQEGALRARYRDGIATPKLLTPNEPVPLTIDMRSIAYMIPKGHRLRLHITSSSFPRLERNLNTGAKNNLAESKAIMAANRVFHGKGQKSYVELFTLPAVQ